MLHRFCFFIILAIASLQAGEIITTSDIAVIEKEAERLDSHCLVLFDVDATLIVPDDAILKPVGKDLFKQLVASCTDRDLFREIRLKASHSIVDPRSISFVQKLQERNIPTLAFTAAPAKVSTIEQPANWRIEELLWHGFDFSPAFPNIGLLELPKRHDVPHLPMFKAGVLFSSLHPKGEILIAFMQIMGWRPKTVIFVDDEWQFVHSVVTSLEEHGIDCIGFHYTAANLPHSELNPEQARFQVDYFIRHNIWLSDDACKGLTQRSN